MKKTKKALASLAIAGMTLTMAPFNAFAAGTVPTRLAGLTAAQTAVEVANQTGWTGTAILASSASYGMVDALTAGPLASYLKAPILLTGPGNVLDAATKAELVKLSVTKVYVTSGTAVISQAVLNELVAMHITVVPLGGFDRAATSVNIASKMVGVTKVAVANGLQDALSIASIASAANQPILLTDKDVLPTSVATFLAANPSIVASDVIGGTGIISDVVKAKLPNATRHTGYTAYDTNNQVIQDFNASLNYGNVYLANGVTGIDALAGAPLAAQTKSAIVLTDGTLPAAATFVNTQLTADSVVTALGGKVVVPDQVLAGIAYKAPVVSEVKAVSTLSSTSVDVVLPTVTKAKEGFTIEVKNPAGTVVPVKPINLEVGDAAVTFEFVTPLTSVAVGAWIVGGVTFDTGAVAAVDAVLNATTQVQLLNALKSSYFTGVKSDNIVTYEMLLNGLTSEKKSNVALIQENVIDAANTVGTEATAVKAVADATNQVELNAALQNVYFKRVNVDFIANYDELLDASDNTVVLVQADIDTVNLIKAKAAVTAAEVALSHADLNSATVLVNNLKADVAPALDKTLLEDRVALQSAVIAVNEANTNAKLTAALNNLATLSTDLDLNTVDKALLTNYRTVISETAVAGKNTASEIQGLVMAANTVAETAAVADLASVTTSGTTTAQFTTKAQTLSDRSANFDATTIISTLVPDYITAIATKTSANKDDATKLQAIISTVNAPQAAVKELDVAAAGVSPDVLLTKLKAVTLTVSNVLDANKAQYFADRAVLANVATGDTLENAAASLPLVQKAVNASNAVVSLNGATSATAARAALSAFAVATDNTDYINLSSTGKLEVAELILKAKATAGMSYATATSVTAEIEKDITARANLITAVNEAGPTGSNSDSISAMATALDALAYTSYENLNGVQKINVAEAFLNGFPVAGTEPAQVDYATLTAIKAAIDVAITVAN